MAESSDKISPSNSKRSLRHFLFRCFGSSPKVRPQYQKPPPIARRNRRTRSSIFRLFKNSSATVPVDSAVPEITVPCHDVVFFSPVFKKPSTPTPVKSRAPAARAEIVELTKPSQTSKKTKSTRSESTAEKFSPAKRTAAPLQYSVSFPSRQLHRQKDLKKSASHLPTAAVATASSHRRTNSPAKKFDLVILMVAVAIVVLWGRACGILCTPTLFYFGRRVRSVVEPDGGGGGKVRSRILLRKTAI